MADDQTRPRRRERDQRRRSNQVRGSEEKRGSNDKPRTRQRGVSGAKLAQHARQQLAEITGLKAEAVTALEPQDDGTWIVTVELLELSRLPETDDLIGSYEAEFDDGGELLGYRRVRRYPRSQSGEAQTTRGG